MIRIILFLLASCLAASAQTGTPTKQSGNVTPSHATCWTTNGIVQDCGTAAVPFLTSIGTVGQGQTICAWSALSTAPGSQKLCFGVFDGSAATITLQNFGIDTPQSLNFVINGVTYPFPYTVGGIVGPNSSTVGDLAIWNNTTGSLLKDTGVTIATSGANLGLLSTNNSYGGDQYFGSGRPWCDPRAEGAKGDGSTDDTAAINACETVVAQAGGGAVFFSPGHYCTFAGLDYSDNNVWLVGLGGNNGAVIIDNCTHNVTTVELNGFAEGLTNIYVIGPPIIAASIPTHDAIQLGSGCAECVLQNYRATGGRYAVNVTGVDEWLINSHVESAYGGAAMYVTGSGYFLRQKVDQTFPGTTPAQGTTFSAWQANHSYTANTIVSTQSFYIEYTNGGTSGLTAPTLASYGTAITDGTATAKLLAPTTYDALKFDTGSSAAYVDLGDFTGPYTNGIELANSLSGAPPQSITITNSVTGNVFGAGIAANAGNALTVHGGQYAACIGSGCQGINFANGWGGDDVVSNALMFSNYYGIVYNVGANHVATGNYIFGSIDNAITIAANISYATITGNDLGSSAAWGANAVGFLIATGSSDYITFTGNVTKGATTEITLGSLSGTHNNIWQEATPLTAVASPTFSGTVTGPDSGTWTSSGLNGVSLGSSSRGNANFSSVNIQGQLVFSSGTPTIASGACGATTNGAVVSGSTNQSGQITIGSASTTTCTISWSATLAQAPNACVFFPMNATAAATGTTVARVGAPSTSSVVLTGSALASSNYAYICL